MTLTKEEMEAIGGKDRPWRNRDSMFYGMTGKAYRRLERKLRRELKARQR